MNAEQPLFGRRRQQNIAGGRKFRHDVKVSAEEQAQLAGRALKQGVSIPRLLVDAALSQSDSLTLNERRLLAFEISEVRRLLANATNNINQLARYAHEERELPEWTETTLDEYRTIFHLAATAIENAAKP